MSTLLPALQVSVEVQMGLDAVRVARVTDVSDLLAGRDARAVLDRVRPALDAFAAVVVSHRPVVVQMDVVVGRAARSVEVEHAARTRGGRPVPDLARLYGHGGRARWGRHGGGLPGGPAASRPQA